MASVSDGPDASRASLQRACHIRRNIQSAFEVLQQEKDAGPESSGPDLSAPTSSSVPMYPRVHSVAKRRIGPKKHG